MKYLSRLSREIISKYPSCVYIFRNKFKDEQVIKIVDEYALVRYTDIKGVKTFRNVSPVTIEFKVAMIWYRNSIILKEYIKLVCSGWKSDDTLPDIYKFIKCKNKKEQYPGVMEYLASEEKITENMIYGNGHLNINFEIKPGPYIFNKLFTTLERINWKAVDGEMLPFEKIGVRKFIRREIKKHKETKNNYCKCWEASGRGIIIESWD